LFLAGDGFIPTHNCKVAANPPAQIRNIISNGVLLHLSGVPFHLVPKRVLQAISEIRHNGRFWQVAKKYGVTESTFASRELPRFDRELLELKRSTGGNPSWAAVVRLWGKLVDKTGDVYQFSEAIFKTAKIIDAMERESMSEGDAALAAQKGLFDYSLVQPSVRYLRNAPVGAPFATFAVKALPAMLDVAIHHPLRFAPYLALPVILTATVAAMADVDSDDVDKLKLALPDWLRERGHAYILPYKDAQGRWAFMDFGYFFPWTQWTELAGELARGEPGKAFQSTGMFGGPLPDLISAIQTNIDPFTRKPIVDPRDSTGQQLGAMMGYLYRMAMPTWLTDVGVAGKLREALTNQVDRYGDPKMTVPQALGRAVGINTYPVEPARSRADNLRRKQREISDVKRRMGERLRDRNLTHEDRQEIIQEYRAEMKERAAEYRDYAKESVVHPNLR
jgi:hypothetical protein